MNAKLSFQTWEPPTERGRAWRVTTGGVMETHDPHASPPPGAVEEVEPQGWDHDHCEMCWATLMAPEAAETRPPGSTEVFTAGYRVVSAPAASRWWICPPCFEDFRERLAWSLVER